MTPSVECGLRPSGGARVTRLCAAAALLLVALAATPASFAIERIVLEVDEITSPATQAAGTSVTLDLARGEPVAHVRVGQVAVPQPIGPLRNVQLDCTKVYVREPEIACREGTLTADGGPTKKIALKVSGEYDTERHAVIARGSELALAGGQAQFSGSFDEKGWSVEGRAETLDITQVRTLVLPWFKAPESLQFTGHVQVIGQASDRGDGLQMAADVTTSDFNLQNEAGTVIAQNVVGALRGSATRTASGLDIQGRLEGTRGQALAGPVLLDLNANALAVEARGQLNGETLNFSDITLTQKNLSQARGQARVQLGDEPRVVLAHVDLANLQFPAAYTSYLQIALASTDFGQLTTTGSVHGSLDINDNSVTQLALYLSGMNVDDQKRAFSMNGVAADLHWSKDESIQVTPSTLSWNSATAYGLSGGATQLEFRTRDRTFELTKPARLPVFDGAVRVKRLETRKLGTPDVELDFDAEIEPISMRRLSKAFGWPELNGQLSGTIPGLSYRNKVLTVDGDIVASVFDGRVVARGLKLENPLGPWPRLHADVTARRLDLSLVTSTFEVGSITGRMDADILGLELFNWSPVEFDARLYSTPGDDSKKLISAKAVGSISTVAGGGAGVIQQLQSGVLKFFDDYRYERLGIACRLENDVCTMSGIEPARTGYYLVKGRGIPRIDVIGNQGQVAWPQLVSQIASGIRSGPVFQ
jgi:hypothetical protein